MASLVDLRPSSSHTPPIETSQSSGTHSPPIIKTTTNTLPPAPRLQPQAPASIPSTPGLEIPGAFPREDSSTSTGAFTDTSQPVPRQKASEPRSYLPTGLASYPSGTRRTSLPSTEKEGVKPGEHYDGVGPLPGSISETSVAKLPDERFESAGEPDKSAQRAAAAGAGVTSDSETSVAKLPAERAVAAVTSEERSGAAEREGPVQDTSSAGLGIVNVGLSIEKNDPDPTSVQKSPERDPEEADGKNVPTKSKFKEEVAAEEKASRERKEERRTDTSRTAEERAAPREPQGGTKVGRVTPRSVLALPRNGEEGRAAIRMRAITRR
ncbi:hypothetical protein BC827DRAFT_1271047 [Russula dissimulans]|nr:hypothetical protein BC827DRAFT_1271047 [Russula dissimulans]